MEWRGAGYSVPVKIAACQSIQFMCTLVEDAVKTAFVSRYLCMSLVMDSPVHSSSSEDFAAFLDAQLDNNSDTSPELELEENDDDDDSDDDFDAEFDRIKRQKVEVFENVEVLESTVDSQPSTSQGGPAEKLEASMQTDLCTHPGVMGGMCFQCGKIMDYEFGVAFRYIHRDLRLANEEIARLRERDLKILFCNKKLCLVLDLDHTLLNSTRLLDITAEEEYLMDRIDSLQDVSKGSLFRLDRIHMMTKLRPYARTFLKEASKLFEMYIYTMGERGYALEMANLLDPENVYFSSRVIAQGDSTQRHQKGLDLVLGKESVVLILDDTELVWRDHKENLILMERYHFFASSCRQFGFNCKSLSELRSDESEDDGALATVLNVLRQIHAVFFEREHVENLAGGDVRQLLKMMKKEILKGCKIVFSRVFPTKYQAENHHLWKMAEQLGALCSTETDPLVTHVVSTDLGTEKSRWALKENKFLVHPQWIEAANYLWRRQPEENFPVAPPKLANQSKSQCTSQS